MPPRKGKKKAAEGDPVAATSKDVHDSEPDTPHKSETKPKARHTKAKPAPLDLEDAGEDSEGIQVKLERVNPTSADTSAASSAMGTPLSERGAPFTGSTAASQPQSGRPGLRQRFADMTRELGKGAEELSVRIRRKVSPAPEGARGR